MTIIKILQNRVLIYLISVYASAAIRFISSLLIALKLGPYNWGLWCFLLLIFNYFQIFNLGIPNSTNILLVQSKSSDIESASIIKNSIYSVGILSVLIAFFSLFYYFFGGGFGKYRLGYEFFVIVIVAILFYFDQVFMTIYRIKNSLLEISVYQSILPVLLLVAILVCDDMHLLTLLFLYLFAYAFSFIFFILRKKIPKDGKVSLSAIKILYIKGGYLFIYNFCFYLILVSTKTLVSVNYSIEEFGYFSFSYTISNSIILLLDAIIFVLFPKLLDKLKTLNINEAITIIRQIQSNYILTAHLLVYLLICIYPFVIKLFPQYSSSVSCLQYFSISILALTHSFPFNTFLMSHNKEKVLSIISIICVIINVFLICLLIYVFNFSYYLMPLVILLSYSINAVSGAYFFAKEIKLPLRFWEVISLAFPVSILFPFISSIVVLLVQSYYPLYYLLLLPLFVFILSNYSKLKSLLSTIKLLLVNPNVINLNK